MLIDPGTIPLQRRVCLTLREDLPATIHQHGALAAVREAIEQLGSAFTPLAGEGDAIAFQVGC